MVERCSRSMQGPIDHDHSGPRSMYECIDRGSAGVTVDMPVHRFGNTAVTIDRGVYSTSIEASIYGNDALASLAARSSPSMQGSIDGGHSGARSMYGCINRQLNGLHRIRSDVRGGEWFALPHMHGHPVLQVHPLSRLCMKRPAETLRFCFSP